MSAGTKTQAEIVQQRVDFALGKVDFWIDNLEHNLTQISSPDRRHALQTRIRDLKDIRRILDGTDDYYIEHLLKRSEA